jgi:hypothetical protein
VYFALLESEECKNVIKWDTFHVKNAPSKSQTENDLNFPKSFRDFAGFVMEKLRFLEEVFWVVPRVVQKRQGDWVFGFFWFFFQGFWVFLNPCILGISKYVKV